METRSRGSSSEFLWLASSWVSNKKSSIISDQDVLDLVLGSLINILLVESNDTLSDSLSDGVNLSGLSSTLNSNSDVKVGESLLSQKKDRLESLKSEDLRLKKLNWTSVDLDQTSSLLAESDGGGGLLSSEDLY